MVDEKLLKESFQNILEYCNNVDCQTCELYEQCNNTIFGELTITVSQEKQTQF